MATSIGQRRLEDGLLGARDETERLAELEQLRTDLLSTIAHELRTPLTAVRTSVSLLQDAEHAPDEDQRNTLLATIDRNALRMQRLVGDILDLARFRAGSIQLQLRRFDAGELATAVIDRSRPLAEAAGQELRLATSAKPVWVFGDYRRLEQALVNLLSNAQKFSPAGAAVDIDVQRQCDGTVSWRVTDRGPGISAGRQTRLFERFFVGLNDRAGGGRGVGLGLPTALAIAQAHRGTIEVESVLGEGSTFTLVVPAEGPEQIDRMKILVVDDEPDVVESVRIGFTLHWREIDVIGAGTGEAALDVVEKERPDIVLLDIGLPDIDGFEVVKRIREFSDVPVVMLTARDNSMDVVKGLEAGADDYVTKPFNHLELMARVRAVLRRMSMPVPTSRAPSFQWLDLEVDFARQEARFKGQRMDLTPTEYKLLYHLVRNQDHILQHATLLAKVWGREYVDEVDYLRVYIRRLRDKLGDDPNSPRYISTERGLGYRFMGQADRTDSALALISSQHGRWTCPAGGALAGASRLSRGVADAARSRGGAPCRPDS